MYPLSFSKRQRYYSGHKYFQKRLTNMTLSRLRLFCKAVTKNVCHRRCHFARGTICIFLNTEVYYILLVLLVVLIRKEDDNIRSRFYRETINFDDVLIIAGYRPRKRPCFLAQTRRSHSRIVDSWLPHAFFGYSVFRGFFTAK